MNTTAKKIVAEAMELPAVLRAFIAEKLIESLDESPVLPLSTAWKEEVRRRCAEIDSSAAQLRDADVVFKNAYASLT
jgi:putative addiction module component (TIGR02574 family)